MGSSKKTPDCECVACKRFRSDWREFWEGFRRIRKYFEPGTLAEVEQIMADAYGCDLCGRKDARRIPHVPDIIQTFFRIKNLCEWCRNRIDYQRRALKWPICWGSTPDDELKWFLLHDALEQFNLEVQRHSPSWIAKRQAHQAWLDSLPKEEPVPDLEITLKRRVQADATQ